MTEKKHLQKPGPPHALEAAGEAASLVSAVSGAVDATAVSASAGFGMAAPLFGLTGLVWGYWQTRQTNRVEKLLEYLLLEHATDRGFVAGFTGELEREPLLRDALLEGVRASVESVCDEVLPALAAVVRQYQQARTRVDGFFRGYCRTLQDLIPEEYESLRELLSQGTRKLRSEPADVAAFLFSIERSEPAVSVSLVRDEPNGETLTRTVGDRLRSTPHTERILRLAAANGIGAMVGAGRAEWQVRRTVFWRLACLIVPEV